MRVHVEHPAAENLALALGHSCPPESLVPLGHEVDGLSSVAYVLVDALRRAALGGTELARDQCATIRLRLPKIGARVKVTVRKVWVALA